MSARLSGRHWQSNPTDQRCNTTSHMVYRLQGRAHSQTFRMQQSHGIPAPSKAWSGTVTEQTLRPVNWAQRC